MARTRLGGPRWQRLTKGLTKGPMGGLARGIAGAAALIAVVTVVSRVVGFGRYLVFAHTVGSTCLGTAYLTANQIPNIVFDIVAGGALSSMVVPVLAGPVARHDAEHVRRVASALLTWTCLVLVPLVVAGVFAAEPLIRLFVPAAAGCARAEVVDVASRMLVIFLPQIVLYGVAAVTYGVLQAHRRFLAPAAAPLANSIVVSAAYILFVPFGGGSQDTLGRLPFGAELILSIGTTLGVAALVLTAVVPTARLRLGLRPTLSFPPGVAPRVRRLAAAGVAALVAQQLATAVVIVLANGYGGRGALPLYTYAWALYLVPYAVLALPIATSAFPALSARASTGDEAGFATTAAATTRGVLLVSFAAAAAVAAAAGPAARVFVLGGPGALDPAQLARALVAFAPGLIGFGLVAHLGRALFAAGAGRLAAGSTVAGWAGVVAADLLLVRLAPAGWVVAALGLGNTLGMTLAGVLLVISVGRVRARAALGGVARAIAAGALGGLAGYAAGLAVAAAVGPVGLWGSVGSAAAAGLAAVSAFAVVVFAVDARDLRLMMRRRVTDG